MNCQVGDLALVIGATYPENVGLMVEVVAPGDALGVELPHWHCRVAGDRAVKALGHISGEVSLGADVYFYDHQLRPIRPGKTPEAIEAPAPVDAVTA